MSRITIPSLISGTLFGAGLALGGMTNPARVRGFLDIFGAWDPTLAFVMGGAVIVMAVAWRMVARMREPWLAEAFHLPTRADLTPRLIGGAALFGVGWGLYGYCPGPAIAALSYLHSDTFLFVAAMLGGTIIHTVQGKKQP